MDKKLEERLIESAIEAVNTFGAPQQMRHTQEECAELIASINHWFRGREGSEEEVAEELADVIIMCAQMCDIFEKLDKLDEQIAEEEADR